MKEGPDPRRPRLVDFHCHLDLYSNHASLIEDCDRRGIVTLAVTTTPKAWPRNVELALHSRHVRVALGLHPQLVAERASEIAEFARYLPEARYVGEVGLDSGPRFYGSLPEQERIFRQVLDMCREAGGKILTVHSIRAVSKVLKLIEERLPSERGRVVLHWFTGTRAEAKRAVELGCYFSINRAMLTKAAHRELVANIPAYRLLTETDGPFVMIGNRQILPSDIESTVDELAQLRSITKESLAAQLLRNLKELVRVKHADNPGSEGV